MGGPARVVPSIRLASPLVDAATAVSKPGLSLPRRYGYSDQGPHERVYLYVSCHGASSDPEDNAAEAKQPPRLLPQRSAFLAPLESARRLPAWLLRCSDHDCLELQLALLLPALGLLSVLGLCLPSGGHKLADRVEFSSADPWHCQAHSTSGQLLLAARAAQTV